MILRRSFLHPGFAVLLSFGFVACVSGPKDNRTFTEKLNGDNYESATVIAGFPILESRIIARKISGRVFCGEGLNRAPVAHAQIEWRDSKKALGTISADINGRYALSLQAVPNETYKLTADLPCGKSSRPLPANLTQDVSDFDL